MRSLGMIRSYNTGPMCSLCVSARQTATRLPPRLAVVRPPCCFRAPIPRTAQHDSPSPYDCRRHSPSSTLRDGIPRDNSGSGRLSFSAPIARGPDVHHLPGAGGDREAWSCSENPDGISAMGRIRSLEMIPPDITSLRGRGISPELAGSGRWRVPFAITSCTEYVVSAKMELVTVRLDRSPNWNPIPAERTLPARPRFPGPFQGWLLQSASLGGGTLRVPAASGPAHRAGTGQPRRAGCCSASKVAEGQAWVRRRGKWEISARQIIISQVRNRSRPSGERAVPWYEGEDLWGAVQARRRRYVLYCTHEC